MSTLPKKSRSHTQYKTRDGVIVPEVTTIVGLMEKPAIHAWIARITKEGHDWDKYRDEMAEIGSLAHQMILAYLKGEKVDTGDYTPNQVDLAENCYLKYLEWAKGKEIKPILVEEPLVDAEHRFGGTPDFSGLVDGVKTLMDYKTGGVYQEAYIQACAYVHLLPTPKPERIIILGIPRTETEKFVAEEHTSYEKGWEIFRRLLEIYWLQRDGKPLSR